MKTERGFTLVEMLVAIVVLALLALMGWRGLEAQVRTRDHVSERMDQIARLQTGLSQWTTDLEAMVDVGFVPALDFDGRSLRITRVDPHLDGQPLRVVAWSQRTIDGQPKGRSSWLRWQSPPLSSPEELIQAWSQAQRWAGNPSQQDLALEVAVTPLTSWQLLYYRQNSWSHPLSSPGGEAKPVDSRIPDGIRLTLQLASGQPLEGPLVKDWLRPADAERRP